MMFPAEAFALQNPNTLPRFSLENQLPMIATVPGQTVDCPLPFPTHSSINRDRLEISQ
jgi:hypothetical protein